LALTAWILSGCTTAIHGVPLPPIVQDMSVPVAQRLHALGTPDVLMLGEQHDAPDHQRQQLATVHTLASLGELAAVVLEMADAGHDTRSLPANATPAQVQQALAWRDSAWPWAQYGPTVMAAVAARVPVIGGNLPRQRNAAVMKEVEWDTRVNATVLTQQRDAVREGHCNLLPSGQIGPMTRIQLARDASLAATVQAAVVRDKTVLLLAGSQHAHKGVGVPAYLPGSLKLKSVRLSAGEPRLDDAGAFDAVWVTPPVPPKDHCAQLKGRG
jgi:uncharacterized iron-regulated protein